MSADDDKPDEKAPVKRDGVRHDARGNAVWQWAVDSGRHALDSTSRLLKRLEVPGLKLEDDALKPGAKPGPDHKAGPTTAAPTPVPAKPERAVGYDPYGTQAASRAPTARPALRPAAAPRKPAAVPPPRPSLLRRLFRKD